MKIHVASIAKITLAFVIIIMVVEPRIKKWVREQQKIKKIEITPGIYTKIYDNFKAEVCQHLTKQRLYLEIAYTKTRIQNNLNADEPIWKSLLFAISYISLLQSTISPEDENNVTAMCIIALFIIAVAVMAALYFWSQSYGNYMDQILRFQCDMLDAIKRECDEGLLERSTTAEIDENNKTNTGSWNMYDYLTGRFTTNALKELQSEESEDKKRAEGYSEGDLKRLIKQICRKMKTSQSTSAGKIATDLAEDDVALVQKIMDTAKGSVLEYDVDKIYKKITNDNS